MAKRKTKNSPSKPKRGSAPRQGKVRSATSNRREIKRLDREVVQLINQRAELTVADSRTDESADVVLERAAGFSKGPLDDRCVRAVFREIISGSNAIEKTLQVAFLGPSYSYSHLAAIHQFGQSVDFLPLGTIGAVFEEVHLGSADFGLVPIENSTDGRVADTLDNFTRYAVRICAEVQLRIHHNLLGDCRRSDIKDVYSRPQALSQCRRWLATHLPAARTNEVTSTSTAAELAASKPKSAAIASLQAGVQYGLKVLAKNIEDNEDNTTRFAVISDQSAARSGNDKTALMFQLPHRPGTLADAVAIFKRSRVNLTWIESFPTPGAASGYLFFLELEGHEKDTRVKRAIELLGKKAVRLEILGSYARSATVE